MNDRYDTDVSQHGERREMNAFPQAVGDFNVENRQPQRGCSDGRNDHRNERRRHNLDLLRRELPQQNHHNGQNTQMSGDMMILELIQKVLQSCHTIILSGHQGFRVPFS